MANKYDLPVMVSTHPRTRIRLEKLNLKIDSRIVFHEPFGFIDYIALQLNSRVVLSDSGTISEEAGILGFPAITIRDSMERTEALEAGSIIMSGIQESELLESINILESSGLSRTIPKEYQISDVSTRVLNFVLSTVHQHHFWSGLHKK